MSMGVGPIPFTAIADYFRMYELEDFDEFAYVIRRMDCVYLELNAEGSGKKESAGGKAKTNGAANSDKTNHNQG